MTGQIGRPGTGLHPLRGQNNVQGASDAGLIPMMLPDYQRVSNPATRARFESAWKLAPGTLDDQVGLTVVEVMHAIKKRHDPRHVRAGREPGHVRPRRQPCTRVAGRARAPGGAGHLPDRDRLPRRRDPARRRLPREDRHLHQHRPPGADGPPGHRPAGRRAAGPVDHRADRQPARLRLELRPCVGGLRRDAPHHAQHRRHHLGAARARARRDLPLRARRRPGPVGGLHRPLPARRRQGALRAGRHHPGGRAPRRRIPDGADHRPPARALAHRQHDAPRRRCSTRSSPTRRR